MLEIENYQCLGTALICAANQHSRLRDMTKFRAACIQGDGFAFLAALADKGQLNLDPSIASSLVKVNVHCIADDLGASIRFERITGEDCRRRIAKGDVIVIQAVPQENGERRIHAEYVSPQNPDNIDPLSVERTVRPDNLSDFNFIEIGWDDSL